MAKMIVGISVNESFDDFLQKLDLEVKILRGNPLLNGFSAIIDDTKILFSYQRAGFYLDRDILITDKQPVNYDPSILILYGKDITVHLKNDNGYELIDSKDNINDLIKSLPRIHEQYLQKL